MHLPDLDQVKARSQELLPGLPCDAGHTRVVTCQPGQAGIQNGLPAIGLAKDPWERRATGSGYSSPSRVLHSVVVEAAQVAGRWVRCQLFGTGALKGFWALGYQGPRLEMMGWQHRAF